MSLYHFGLPLGTAGLAAYAPLPFAPTYDPRPEAKLRTPRDHLIYLLAIVVLQFFALHPIPSAIDVLVLLPLVLSTLYLRPSIVPDITAARNVSGKEKDRKFTPTPMAISDPKWSYWKLVPGGWKPHFQTILNNDSSRKILYFLLINLGYMGVQMGYGVVTNSLGLISDGAQALRWTRA
jgi:zinc transporter 5/7